MKNKRFFFLGLLLLLTAAFLPADNNGEKAEIVQVTGTVRLVGSAIFPQLVITGTRVQWYVAGDEMDKLLNLQQRTVTVEGEAVVREIKFANGRSAGTLRELSNIKIIEIQEQ